MTAPGEHPEVLPDGSEVKLGVFLSNTKTRRAKLTTDKLAAPGLEWAAA
ncbi:helicase [Streptomyces prunicolor]|uniref:Helicase n=1 Tax=Streptomyces prunicolor TaxID=67348 RepID=A0ABU4FIK4_9ACTN|nr:helicase [Streptomyces prunicolor]MDV7220422.1 helicase [Streptomyces prunicolor]